ncbi:MAG: hypothetical protein N4A53_12100 [Pelagimonas sp.]|jgi:hypothetical protein|nr:hypothetical protein [Pelagimonas sp.]
MALPSINRLMRPFDHAQGRDALPLTVQQSTLALAIGGVALLVPVLPPVVTALIGVCQQPSISDYFYVPFAGGLFVTMLGFVGLVMLSYTGHTRLDFWMAKAGGVCALLVALLPTSGSSCTGGGNLGRPLHLSAEHGPVFVLDGAAGLVHQIHLGAALGLFLILALFCLWSFRRDNGEGVVLRDGRKELSRAKTKRNRLYTVCGLVILTCIAGLFALVGDPPAGQPEPSAFGMTLFFWCEAVALFAFGLSWLVKGRIVWAG